ncbi:SDR family NAD(P)-dependent oxidoreductase [Falsigemmobacter intermedius]|uniref:SDR family oxidoreductase n=1 Tax=Falsigemmobacter intermedius TaxID=1553448 RepID=A0A451GHD7_9RHOB|nr:SDR family oxidoreductase [Falsigemmobacter intermedius]RWY37672.1 SDR family oxidoreductase [Falsigemmobacter intermedius]
MSGMKRVVVTGGASGIGFACAEVLRAEGWSVVLADVNADLLQARAAQIGAEAAVLDVSDPDATEALAARLADSGGVQGLVASAGVLQRPVAPHELSMAEWDHVMNIDLRGVYISCRAFGTRMARAGTGAIVTISSGAGMLSTPMHSYGPAKAGVISLTQSLAAEWGRSGVRVNGVAPGFTLTEAVKARLATSERDISGFERDQVIGRALEPVEIARPVAFLLSDAASAITGTTLPVDGGIIANGVWPSYGGLRGKYSD